MSTTPKLAAALRDRLSELEQEATAIKAILGTSAKSSSPAARRRVPGRRKWSAKQKAEAKRRMKAIWKARKAKG
jgi:hypothetical protein